MRIWIVRHGETDWNIAGLLQGSKSNIPLNSNGINVAILTAEGLKKSGIRFHKVYSSPLARAIDTAQIISGTDNIIVDDRITEYDFGEIEGECIADLAIAIPIAIERGGESMNSLRSRVRNFLSEIVQDSENEQLNILVSTHGMALRAILSEINNFDDIFDATAHDNCGITILNVQNGQISILDENIIYYK